MNVGLLLAVLRKRAQLAGHDRWRRDELLAYQAQRLSELRRFAAAHSPLYVELHRGLEDAPLAALPTLTKATLMDRFDELVTDRDVRLVDVERHVASTGVNDLFHGRYRVAATGGTTGRRGIFLADPDEWTTVLASYARAQVWAGVAPGLTNRMRMAVVSSTNASHQSSIVGASVASRLVPTLRLDATEPLPDTVAALNDFRPDTLVGYASALRVLADEQLAGRLRVSPRAIMSASEVLTDAMRAHIHAAFGVAPTNVYAATETAGIASECRAGHLHRYEDLVIAEIVDEDNQPVSEGDYGAKLLVSVLFSRTQPLIRYELSDRVASSAGALPSDLPYATLAGIEGRQEEVLTLAGVSVHPNVFHAVLEQLPLAGWQVIEETGGLRVLVAQPPPSIELTEVARSLDAALSAVGVRGIELSVQAVDAIPRTKLGKAPLVRRAAPAPPENGLQTAADLRVQPGV